MPGRSLGVARLCEQGQPHSHTANKASTPGTCRVIRTRPPAQGAKPDVDNFATAHAGTLELFCVCCPPGMSPAMYRALSSRTQGAVGAPAHLAALQPRTQHLGAPRQSVPARWPRATLAGGACSAAAAPAGAALVAWRSTLLAGWAVRLYTFDGQAAPTHGVGRRGAACISCAQHEPTRRGRVCLLSPCPVAVPRPAAVASEVMERRCWPPGSHFIIHARHPLCPSA